MKESRKPKIHAKALLLTGILGLGTILAACKATLSDASSAVICDRCQAVWVKRPQRVGSPGKGSIYVLRNEKTMVCPDCESAVATFFKTGSLRHGCSQCGGTMSHCTNH